MKKFILLALAALLALPVTAAIAAINGSTHDVTVALPSISRQGMCSPCHVPHGGGDRLFPISTPAGYASVGNLCAACHYSGGYPTPDASVSQANVYDTNSHAGQMNVAQWPDGPADYGYLNNSGLPYVNLTTGRRMHCTSCHNVHDNTFRPFLRDDLLDICGNCHPHRHFINGTEAQFGPAANWVEANARSANPGSHPVGADVNASFLQTWSTVTVTVTAFNMPRSASNSQWSLGGHLTGGASGGVHCVTCHTVHGRMADPAVTATIPSTTDHQAYTNFLEIDQASTTLSYTTGGVPNRSVASGFGDDNAFCEACHNGVESTSYTVVGGAVDPGRTGYTHPLDGITPSDNGWVTGWSTWPQGSTSTYNTGMTPVALCESCHVVHPFANNGGTSGVKRADVNTGADSFLLRNDTGRVCNDCHSGSTSAHHPVGMTYNANGATYLPNNAGGGAKQLLCSTCHGGGQGGAHNWPGVSTVAMASAWIPVNNARAYTANLDARAYTLCQTCMDCHFNFDGDTNRNPTLGSNKTTYVNLAGEAYSYYGIGTHWMGADDSAANLTTELKPVLTTIYTTMGKVWTAGSVQGAQGGWSRFGSNATGPVIVCESCHELEPAKNNGAGAATGRHLLLANYIEGQNGDNGDADGRDDFCEACHLPAGTHAMTGMTVTRTGTTLAIDTAKAWLVTLATGSPVTWTVSGSKLSCDSCHQPHDAATGSYNMVLDARSSDCLANTITAPTTLIYVPYYPDGNRGPDNDTFCNYCHAY